MGLAWKKKTLLGAFKKRWLTIIFCEFVGKPQLSRIPTLIVITSIISKEKINLKRLSADRQKMQMEIILEKNFKNMSRLAN